MPRSFVSLSFAFCLVIVTAAQAVTIREEDFDTSLASPCVLHVAENGSVRTLSWNTVSGAQFYRVGYEMGTGTIIGLAEVTTLSYDHQGWDPNGCMEYVMVAYDATANPICSAHVQNVGHCP